MDLTKAALIAHVNTYNNDQDPKPFKTIKGYGGQIEDIEQLIDPLPGAYIETLDNTPIADDRLFKFDILIITESRYYDQDEHLTENDAIVGNLCRWIAENQSFSDDNHSYEINTDLLKVDPFQHDNTYTITAIEIVIQQHPN